MEEPLRDISIHTLGTFELAFNGRPVERWRAGKARNLLQFLLLRPGRVVSRDSIFQSLWPDAGWSKESSLLKVAAHMLRNILEANQEGRRPVAGPTLRLLTRDPGYLLEASQVAADFQAFTTLADRGYEAQRRGDRAAAATLYQHAAELYVGDFLPDEHYDWAVAQREWLRSRLLCAIGFLTGTCILRGDHTGVIRWCQQMLEAEPLHEEAYRALILVHAHLGQLSQADRWYRLCSTRLRDNVQAVPALATRQLHDRAIRGELTGRPIDLPAWQAQLQPTGYASLLATSA